MASRFSNVNIFGERTVTGQLPFEIEHYTISMLVIGSSGVGKSMFCNFLAETETLFAESCGMESVTDRVEHCVKKIGREKVLLLDSPGFNDPMKSDVEIFEKISGAAILNRGVDVIAIVVNPTDRYFNGNKKSLKIIENLGGNMWEHAFIIFNHASKIEKTFKKIPEEYIKQLEESAKCPKELKEMLKEVGHRYICVESADRRGDDNYWQRKSKEVVGMIIRIRNQNMRKEYKNEIMHMGLRDYKRVKRLEKENIEKNKEIKRLNEEDQNIQEIREKVAILGLVHKLNEFDSMTKDALLALIMLESMKNVLEGVNIQPPPPPPPPQDPGCSVM